MSDYSLLKLPKKICEVKIFWEEEAQAFKQSSCLFGNCLQSLPCGDEVE